jgi:hypothetical protein
MSTRRVGVRLRALCVGAALCSAACAVATDADTPARDGCCDRCGGAAHVSPMCVKTLTEKEVTKVCWGYRSEEICIPGPSIFCGTRHHRDDCGCWTCWLWKPTCAEIITKRVPVKKEVTRKIPAVEWKVEERCCACRHATTSSVGASDRDDSQEP